MTKLKNSNCDKTQKLKTQIVTKTDEISQGSFLRSRDVLTGRAFHNSYGLRMAAP